MKSYEAAALIEAPPDAVWAILTDAPGLSRWDSGIERVEGGMRWSGGMPLGLFKGERTFSLAPQGDGRSTQFNVRVAYTGPLLGMMWKSMPDLGPSFKQFASGLKREAESKSSVS